MLLFVALNEMGDSLVMQSKVLKRFSPAKLRS